MRKCIRMAEGALLNSIVFSSHARHVSTWLIVLASYDEYTALVKSGNAASKHVWRAVSGTYRWWKPGYRDLLRLCDVSSGYVPSPLFFLQHT